MFDILVYLVENYFDDQACPDPDTLELKLKVAGFDDEDINDALTWLAGLDDSAGSELPPEFALRATFRSYSVREEARLSRETRGFLYFWNPRASSTPSCASGSSNARWLCRTVWWTSRD